MISNEKYNLANLPPEMVGNILKYLTVYTGSKGILNDKDIPVIMRYGMNLARTCKQLYATFNDPITTDMFVQALTKKYGQCTENFAALLDTLGARKWLWLSMKEQGLDKTYEAIQDIYELASKVKKEVNESGLKFNLTEGRSVKPEPQVYHFQKEEDYLQTKEGLALNIDAAPNYLSTPFGGITLYDGEDWSNNAFVVSEIFIKKLDAVLEDVSEAKEGNFGFYEIVASDRLETKITLEDFKKRKGTQNLIVSIDNTIIYRVRKAGNNSLPNLTWYQSSKTKRSLECVKSMWRMLEQKRLGKDPFAFVNEIASFEKKLIKLKKIYEKPFFNDLSEVSKWGISQIKLLCQQPLNKGKGTFYKFLDIHQLEALLVKAIHETSKKFSDIQLSIEVDDPFNDYGLVLNTSDSKEIDINFENIEKAYEISIQNIGKGWKRATLEDYPEIGRTESEEEFDLFVKDEWDTCYYILMWLIEKLGVNKHLSLNLKKDSPREFVYLWIKKDKQDFVFKKLKLDSSLKNSTSK